MNEEGTFTRGRPEPPEETTVRIDGATHAMLIRCREWMREQADGKYLANPDVVRSLCIYYLDKEQPGIIGRKLRSEQRPE